MSNYGRQGPTGGGGGYGARDRSQATETIGDQWEEYLKAGYFDADGNLFKELVSPEKVEPLIERMADEGLTTGQLRRFFQHCRGIESQLKSGTTSWPQVRTKVEFLAAAAADAYGKQPPKIPSLFYSFIRRNVDSVKTEKDFLKGFLPHFEALVGFGSLYLQKERN